MSSFVDMRVMEDTVRRLKRNERRLEDTTRRETVFTNTLKAWHYNNDLVEVFDRAEALATNVTIILQPGTTYTLSAAVAWASETHGLTVVGNGATINCPNALGEYAFAFVQCTGRYIFENILFVGTDEQAACLRALFFQGTGKYIVRDCEFTGFGIGGVFCNNYTAELLLVENCKFYELGNTRNGGSDNGIGIAPTYVQNLIIRDCEFHTIGTTNNDHGIYGWRGPSSGVGNWQVLNCRFGASMYSCGFFREDSGEIGTAIIDGCVGLNTFYVYCTDLKIINSKFPSIQLYSVDTVEVTGCLFTGGGVGQGVTILDLTGGGIIEGNTFKALDDGIKKTTTGALVGLNCSVNTFLDISASGVLIEAGSGFTMTNCTFKDNLIEAGTYCYYFTADTLNCSVSGTHRIGTGSEFMRLDGTNTELHVFDNDAAGSISFSGATLTNCNIESPYDNTTPALELFQFASTDATPSVAVGSYFQTANSSGTTITAFDDAVVGKEFWVLINDANTTLDFTTSSLSGNNGVDYTCANGDMLRCFKGASKTHVWISEA